MKPEIEIGKEYYIKMKCRFVEDDRACVSFYQAGNTWIPAADLIAIPEKPEDKPEPVKWEYMTMCDIDGHLTRVFEEGEKGWEMFAVTDNPTDGSTQFYFKRLKSNN